MASAIGTAAITYGASMISTILQPMAAKAMDIIKDKGKAVFRSRADKAMSIIIDKRKAILRSMEYKAMDEPMDKVVHKIEKEISSLQKTLRMIEGIVRVAEVKQIDDDFIQNWLRDLLDITYEARDVLDDFITAEEAADQVNFISPLLPSYFGSLSDDTSKLSSLAVLNQLAKDIRSFRKRFDEKKKEGEKFATLKSVVGEGFKSVKNRRPIVGPSINKQRDGLFLGREDVKQGIMEKILHPSDDNRVHVVPIWGMGGIGKTTLARSIYNDKRVKKVTKSWLCVRENKFSAKKIITKIIGDSSTNDDESLKKKLVEKFRGNRFLIVLDDVWDVDRSEWKILTDPLTNIRKGGVIILTTRRSEVITETDTLVPDALRPLSHQDSWSIFESLAFIDGKSDPTPDLKRIGKKIVKKLNGLPLALKVVGRSLLNKDSSTWTKFLESKLIKDDEVMSALRWSYNHLPPHLKMCFTYCALFPKDPKDHVLDKKVLVEMWMAHDLIQKEEQERPEDVGAQYFEELVNASLLQYIDGKYVMHDLIHDLALLVSNGEFASANSSLTNDQMKKVHHITITEDDYSKIPCLGKIEKLLTLYTIRLCHDSVLDVFKQLKSIRVLVLSSEWIYEIPDCISELKHLRYLDVSQTKVESLPYSLCHLYNLQMLAAPLYAKLPRDTVNMVNLRHLRANLSTCKGVGKLTSLQELSSIHVCEGDNIRELGDMQRLRGKLTIKGLENVTSKVDAAGALMKNKTLMDELLLVFNQQLAEPNISEEVLDALGCPPNLTYLQISGYTGVKSPSWMVDGKHKFYKLQTLELFECPKLQSLPSLGDAHLSSLRDLFIEYCPQLQSLPPDFHKLSSLNSLKIKSCPQLQSLPPDFHKLSSLNSLKIKSCPQLHSLPLDFHELSSLESLHIEDCPQLQSLPLDFHKLSSLNSLKIKSCPQLQSLPLDFHELSSLESLHIEDCPQLQSLPPDFHKLSSLNSLKIKSCPQLKSLPLDFHELSSLVSLHIEDCPQLQSLPSDFRKLSSLNILKIKSCPQLQSLPPDFHELPSLKKLRIYDCPQLQSLPPNFHKLSRLKSVKIVDCSKLQSLPGLPRSMKLLELLDCPLLYERCKDESGVDWHKIKGIRKLTIFGDDKVHRYGGDW